MQLSNSNIHLASSIFTALHGMQTRSSDEKDVCPAVCLSVKRVNCDKMEERSPLQREILGHPLAPPVGAKSSILNRYSLVALQP